MELRQLRYFLAVARTLNFTRAAEQVHIAQPPLSRQIAHLEDELGVKLIERGKRAIRLTPAGVYFAEHSRDLLTRVQHLKDETAAIGGAGKQTFRQGTELSLLYGHMAKVIHRLSDRYPLIKSEIVVLPGDRLLEALREGEIDFALGRELTEAADIEQIVIRQEALMLAVPADRDPHRYPEGGVYLAHLHGDTFILHTTTSASAWRSDATIRLCDRAGIEASERLVLGDLAAALGLVAAGGGVAIVPAAAQAIRSDDVAYVPLLDDQAQTPVVLSGLRGQHRDYLHEIHRESLQIIEQTQGQLKRSQGDAIAPE